MNKDVTSKPLTPPLPGWNKGIKDPSKMAGSAKGLGKGATWLLKFQMYNILKANGVDPHT